ncbi:MAG: membrane or secreted protein [Flavobacteriia bacterium]|uniref:membrane or secreted protein n=1 Tax=Flagellimonas sp. TaxID=2058762 RepID=UPI001003632E|nr:MAG: membrane or secreted protein [Flavobacteriia bacterium]
MRQFLFTLLGCLCATAMTAQDLQGAWEMTQNDGQGTEVQHIAIIAGDYISKAFFEKETGKFIGTKGGSYKADGQNFTYLFEYASLNPDLVGTQKSVPYEFVDGKLHLGDVAWTKIDDGTPGDLSGAWLISGRKQDGEIVKRDTSGPRKTMKILSGTRFQWIAYNTETKEFMGTGGGTYTTVNGKYTETIGFFSRDDSRVGASLQFDYSLEDGDWHHSGLSSKGQPIYEVWSRRTE